MNHPLRLGPVGPHRAGSGKGCAMNVISWENGDTTITDLPACADVLLARIVQRVNDQLCTHRDGDLLCPACSLAVLALAHRTVGTSGHGLTADTGCRLELAHRAITLFTELTGITPQPPDEDVTRRAVANMLVGVAQ
jgi:hypothetical protein